VHLHAHDGFQASPSSFLNFLKVSMGEELSQPNEMQIKLLYQYF